MSYKTILAILQSEADAPRVLDLALPLAARHDSHVIGLHAEALPMVMASPMGGPVVDLSIDMQEETSRRHAIMRALFEERARVEGVANEWRGFDSVSGDSAISGIESARSADLVVAQQTDPDATASMAANIEALLFETGRPVLLVPYVRRVRSAEFRKVLLAWNGSQQAARAAFDALPFMMEAESVEVLCIDPQDTPRRDASMAGTAIAAALARHGIEVDIKIEISGGISHGEAIDNRISDTGADLLVMGAFGRSRLKEFVFGGATRTILQTMTIPTLLAH
ncbi:universal stress protein [Nitratireductor sp. ZSWI3]|uniref:universal stress protein n=1 Tax=Nitratireductor sp. ZSWI3 TaxID=2966359 RepID=UPI00214F800D|nr:universal stress protein [Nitratireductor sp. ZSWI3]MCR4267792.1 universal stress protein [Nitratireductor sp. ZSWI3]